MKRRVKTIIGLACCSLLCVGLAACVRETELTKLEKENFIVGVVYDPNGGKLFDRSGVTIDSRFNPDTYTDTDNDGKIEISLKTTDPVTANLVTSKSGIPTKIGYSFAGWYRNCELSFDDENRPLDDYGNLLEQREDGKLYIAGTDTVSKQGYVYSGLWDFDKDKLVYELGTGKYSITLYAAWVPEYQFNYYYQKENSSEWTLFGSTTFSYTETQAFKDSYPYTAAVSKTMNAEWMWVPRWSGANDTGEMVYSTRYSDNQKDYTFPAVKDYTFASAYSDETCTQKIEDSFQHSGKLVYNEENEKLEIENLFQNIYVKFEKGEQYRVTNAKEFTEYAKNAKPSSVYTILADELDFSKEIWPSKLSTEEFAGKIIGNGCTFKNITAENTSDEVKNGGLFASIAADAEITDIDFVNVTYDIKTGTTAKLGLGENAGFGLFTGYADAKAKISGIRIENSVLRIGKLFRNSYQINLVCGNGLEGVSSDGVSLVLYGEAFTQNKETKYRYYVVSVEVNAETGDVLPKIEISSLRAEVRDEESYVAYPKTEN